MVFVYPEGGTTDAGGVKAADTFHEVFECIYFVEFLRPLKVTHSEQILHCLTGRAHVIGSWPFKSCCFLAACWQS